MHSYAEEQTTSVIELDTSSETEGDSFNMTDSLTCVGCEEEMENCQCKHIMATFHQLNHQLYVHCFIFTVNFDYLSFC